MAKEPNKHPSSREFIDRKTWGRIGAATQKIAETGGQPYNLPDSFLWADLAGMEEPDSAIGSFTEKGDLESGKTKFIWFNPDARDMLSLGGEDNLKGQIEFAKQVGESYFYGVLKMYEYQSGEGDIELVAHGYFSEPSDDMGFEFNGFANQIGLSSQFRQLYEYAGEPSEQQLDGNIDRQASWNVAYALQQQSADLS